MYYLRMHNAVNHTQVYAGQEFYIWSWSSITTAGSQASIWDVKFPIVAIPYYYMEQHDVMMASFTEIAAYLTWEVRVLMYGRFPERGTTAKNCRLRQDSSRAN